MILSHSKATSFPSLGRLWAPLPVMERDVEETLAPSLPQQPQIIPTGSVAGGTTRLLPPPAPLVGRSEVSPPAPYQPL